MKFDFTKNRAVENLDAVPENCRAFYEKAEGDDAEGFNLRTDEQTTAAVAIITGQNKALKTVRQEVTDAKAAKGVDLSALEAYGTTVEEIALGVATKVEELTINANGKESDIAQRIAAVKKEHGEAIAALKNTTGAELEKKQGQLENYMLETAIMNAGAGWQNLNTTLVTPFARRQMAVQEIDGKPRVVVVGDDGEAKYSTSPERAGELMNTEELLIEMSEDKSLRQLFPSQQAASGGGAQGTNVPGRRPDTSNMSAAEKIASSLPGAKK